MEVFDSTNYKLFTLDWIKSRPKEGRGEFRRIAEFLNVSSVLISQIFKGDKDISTEQALKLCDYFGFIELEKKYFLALVNLERAGTFELKNFYQKECEDLRKLSKDISKRVTHTDVLSEEDKAIFYSDWKYSAIRLTCGLEKVSKEKLMKFFDLKEETLNLYLDFLLSRKLIKVDKGYYQMGPSSTHVSKDSPFVKQHHRNWRLRAIDSIDAMEDSEIMYTAPMCVSKELYQKLNKKFLQLIDEFVEEAKDSKADDLYYLNIDLRIIK